MKLLVKKLWFPHSIEDVMSALFEIPQLKEQFDEGYAFDSEMRPQGIKICSGYWPADKIMERLPVSDKDVSLVLTSMDLKGDYGRIHGKGYDRRAIGSSYGFTTGFGVFHPDDTQFNAMLFGEIGHALGLAHHDFDPSNPCEMSHNELPGPHSSSLDNIRFCDDCYQQLK